MSDKDGRTEPAAPEFKPFVAPEVSQAELTLRAVLIGSVLGVVFAASSVYLGLKVGLTVSASIPVAVLSITLFRWMSKVFGLRPATILENNIVQTTGSAGESIAAGIAFTMPSLLLMGFDMELTRVLLVGLLGGLIGVLMMIPLRHGLIVKEHGKLTYPEGTACADVLIVGEKGGTSAVTIFFGFFVGLIYAFLNLTGRLWNDTADFVVDFGGKLKGAMLSFEVSPTMLGVGYIIGIRTASNMMAGGVLAFMVLVPLIHLFGDSMLTAMYPATEPISKLGPMDIRSKFILYIGAGAVATGGFIALARAIPTIIGAFKGGMGNIGAKGAAAGAVRKRTERDLPMSVVLGGSLAIAVAIWAAPILQINAASAALIVLFGFFFVTVSSRITGEIGSSSNPISGMTVATLLITCGLFVAMGWTGVGFKAMALTTAALVCVAASNGGTISQDLKTGYLVGATPRHQQVSILIGVVSSAILIGFTTLFLNQAYTTFKPVEAPAFALPSGALTDQKMDGPDKQNYAVAYLHEDAPGVDHGKYLVDGQGKLAYLVDPGVCGTYPYDVQPWTGGGKLTPAADASTEMGPDHKPYRVVALTASQGDVAAGRYLVRDDGSIAYGAHTVKKFDAPKAQLFRLIIDGTLGGKLPFGLVLMGVFLALIMELVGVSSLPFAVGLYLPLSTSAGIFVGGLVRWLVDRKFKGQSATEAEFSPGTLMASGLIAGGAIAGVADSAIRIAGKESMFDWHSSLGDALGSNVGWWPMSLFLLMAALLLFVGTRKPKSA